MSVDEIVAAIAATIAPSTAIGATVPTIPHMRSARVSPIAASDDCARSVPDACRATA